MTQIKSDFIPVGQILKADSKYKVPPHQRNFSWTSEEVTQLWEDILEGMSNDRSEYFLGTIVIQEDIENKTRVIIDGQQRIATLTILLASIRTIYAEYRDDRETEVFNEFLGMKDRRTRVIESRISLNEINEPCFQRLIINNATDDTLQSEIKTKDPSNKHLITAALLLRASIRNKIKSEGKHEKFLIALEEFIVKRIRMIVVIVGDEADAYLIFETLNDRGLDLSISDLLKNYIFSRTGTKLGIVRTQWQEMAVILGSQDQTIFMRHYWLSKYGVIRERDLFREMKRKFSSQIAILGLMSDLRDAAEKYSAISIVDHPTWKEFGTPVRNDLETLQLFGVSQFKPLLLATLEHFKPGELPKVIRLIVVLSMRYNIIGSLGTGNIERAYSEIAIKIRNGKINTAAKIFTALKNIYPPDNKFEVDFAQKEVAKPKLARYILASIANKIQNSKELGILEDEKSITLEHIMPKTRTETWIKAVKDEDEYMENINRLGNLTLIEHDKNRTAASATFSKKKYDAYSQSDIAITKDLCKDDNWTTKEISLRQSNLAKTAVDVWSLPY
ncbi:MAG: DUF262 domain-containing HNH endonuclease family protein [Candidatus Margulisiibacteriota bacterium]